MSVRLTKAIITEHQKLNDTTFLLMLKGKGITDCEFGQFINLKIEGSYLRRPISISMINNDTVSLCYKVVGIGTKNLSECAVGQKLDCMVGLGTGFSLPDGVEHVTIVGGGIGVAPLVGWYNYLRRHKNLKIDVVLGFNKLEDGVLLNYFHLPTVVFNSEGQTVVDALEKLKVGYMYSCGPEAMLETLAKVYEDGQMLFEARMGCGFGACMGCAKQVGIDAYKRVCVEGPVFFHKEVRYSADHKAR